MESVELPFLTAPPSHELRERPSTRRRHVPSLKVPTTPQRITPKDVRLSTTSPCSAALGANDASPSKLTSRIPRKISSARQPLVPFTERKPREARAGSKGNRDEFERWDLTPDGSSAGREGRHFTVANVGNNGRIYLRPSVRPSNQRYPSPNLTFPVTPPGTAGVESVSSDKLKVPAKAIEHYRSQHTPTPRTSMAIKSPKEYLAPTQTARHRRALSDGTVHGLSTSEEPDTVGYRAVISKPGQSDEQRPKTMDNLNSRDAPMLNIHIPSWRLGTPRFTSKGTPIIRGSSYAPTEDIRSSGASMLNPLDRTLNMPLHGLKSKRPSHLVIPQVRFPHTSQVSSPRLLHLMRSNHVLTHLGIEPAMFTDLTFKPASDDKSIVRFASTGTVTAATAPRLVAEITSPNFLDYELISDFFLTFRFFLEPRTLLRLLTARLQWALARHDEVGMIVRVRTFVAMRHWILNYFIDDFVFDHDLRVTLCTLLNDLVDELSQDTDVRKIQLKIVAELKKCWRRICARYWDGPDFDDTLGADIPIAPGGIAGNRDPCPDLTSWKRRGVDPPQWDTLSPITKPLGDVASPNADIPRTARTENVIILRNRPGTPENGLDASTCPRNGPTSPLSMDIVSCSFPSKNIRSLNPNSSQALAAHPVYSTSPTLQPGAIATTPRALAGKRVRPTQSHKRNNSIADSSREHSPEKSSINDTDFSMTLQSAGNLVRGNLLPPGQPFVNIEPEHRAGDGNRETTICRLQSRNVTKEKGLAGAMSGYGMKKLLGSVRRALSSRGQWPSGTESSLANLSPVGPRGVTTNRLPGTAVVPHGRTRKTGARPPVRIDILGAEVAEDFRKAIREEEVAAEAEHMGISIPISTSAPTIPGPLEYSAAHLESSTFDCLPQNLKPRPVSEMGIITGSKPMVIVDDTALFEMSGLRERLHSLSPSAEALPGDPTPPTTPPAHSMGSTPRSSSCLLNEHGISASGYHEALPPDLATLVCAHSFQPSQGLSRRSFSPVDSSRHHSSFNRRTLRMHKRNNLTKAPQSVNSIRRHASFSSGVVPRSTVQGLDITTDPPVWDINYENFAPEPAHVLRRHPGGDLRAATNVGDLDNPIMRTSRSAGSLTTYTGSIPSTFFLGSRPDSDCHFSSAIVDDHPVERQGAFSVGQLTGKAVKLDLSLFSTHSSKPIMCPSFEHEAIKLAQIPDDDDGGIESALLKLEGKFQSKCSQFPQKKPESAAVESEEVGEVPMNAAISGTMIECQVETGNYCLDSHDKCLMLSADRDRKTAASEVRGNGSGVASRPFGEVQPGASRESYCSIPLLDRGLTDDGRSKRTTLEWTNRSIFRDSDDDAISDDFENRLNMIEATEPQHTSFDFVFEKMHSMRRTEPGQIAPSRVVEDQTFFDDDSVDGTDPSSKSSVVDSTRPGTHKVDTLSMRTHPPHPFGDPISMSQSDSLSAPMTLAQALDMMPEKELHQEQTWRQNSRPLTPAMTPVAPCMPRQKASSDLPGVSGVLRPAMQLDTDDFCKHSVHLPFILAFDSDILAQQFTLVEKDALNDIDWKDLIEMKWKDTNSKDSRSWVDFLRDTDAHGVEVVIARFNIMVKWAISEIVLTQHIEERARCIIKFIHIAAHCRRYRNFATLAQLTMALSSSEVSRLTQTWELVPAYDLKTHGDLEKLLTPTRNFYSLRAEMESGSSSGCIPFVGIYTHDLTYNAQRHSDIVISPTTPLLINFERYRVAAAVVKTLLRLMEASARYTFQPIEGIIERCLWMGALSDEEIRRHSKSLQ